MGISELMTQLGTAGTGLFLAYTVFQQYFPDHLRRYLQVYTQKLISYFSPYIRITFDEFASARLERSEAYTAIRDYLSTKSTKKAKRFKADVVKDSSKPLVLNMAENEEVEDEFQGVKVWWASSKTVTRAQSFSIYPAADEKRYYQLTCHRRHREIVTGPYIDHVLKRGKDIAVVARQRKLYTNNRSKDWDNWRGGGKWSHVIFEHPASFDTLGMAKGTKEELIKDLMKFGKGKEYYKKIGKAWKRGYLLYGPPGTGKSSMIAAIANFMEYDIYDLELTTVKNNSELRKLLIETTGKSVIVIEDIDCSVDFTDKRKSKKEEEEEEKEKDPISKKKKEDEKENSKKSEVTLSGLLNIIDGIWSACGGERIIIFTTNYVEKLDPALIRRGRMDKHIEMSYCRFEAFQVLANNYLDVKSHKLFPTIEQLLQEVEMTPADIAENLMPKSEEEDQDACLKNLVSALEEAKEKARRKSEEEALAKLKGEEGEEETGSVAVVEAVNDNGTMSIKEVKENGVVTDL